MQNRFAQYDLESLVPWRRALPCVHHASSQVGVVPHVPHLSRGITPTTPGNGAGRSPRASLLIFFCLIRIEYRYECKCPAGSLQVLETGPVCYPADFFTSGAALWELAGLRGSPSLFEGFAQFSNASYLQPMHSGFVNLTLLSPANRESPHQGLFSLPLNNVETSFACRTCKRTDVLVRTIAQRPDLHHVTTVSPPLRFYLEGSSPVVLPVARVSMT